MRRIKRRALETRVLCRIDMTVPGSDAIKQEIGGHILTARNETIHNGIEVLPLAGPPGRPLRRNVFRIITVGRLAPVKTHAIARGRAELAQDLRVQLDIVDDGPERVTMEQCARTLGIATQVRFLGFRNDVRASLAHADAFVITSGCEGISIAILGGDAAGLPIVVTDVGGIRETVIHEQTGIVVPTRARPERVAGLRVLRRTPPGGKRWARPHMPTSNASLRSSTW